MNLSGEVIRRKTLAFAPLIVGLFFLSRFKPGFDRSIKTKPAAMYAAGFFFCRGSRIRTCDPLVPNQMR